MPWQRQIADVGLELDPDSGLPAYREIVWTVPRQSGKTTLVLSWELHRALMWHRRRQRCVYTAQSGVDAEKKLLDDQVPLIEDSPFAAALLKVSRAAGKISVRFRGGGRIDLLPKSQTAGHGGSIHLAVMDEAFAHHDATFTQTMLPAMIAQEDAQMLVTSTAGTEDSVLLNSKIAAGRRSVESGSRSEIAYFEWSAADEQVDIEDPAVWYECMPALGITIGEPAIRHALHTMLNGGSIDGMTGPAGFMRAFLNVSTTSDQRVIPLAIWLAVQDAKAKPADPLVFGFDVNPERSWSSIAVSGGDAVELVEHRRGIGWTSDRLVELVGAHGGSVAMDPAGPAGAFLRDLLDRGLRVHEVAGRDFVQACGSFFDDVLERRVRIFPHPDLDAAVAGAAKRQNADAWAWARRLSDADISPLVAATVARWVARQPPAPSQAWAFTV